MVAGSGLLARPVGTTVGPVDPPYPLPTAPAPFHHLLRGPRWRWWKPLLSLLVLIGAAALGTALVFWLGNLLYALLSDRPFDEAFAQGIDPLGLDPLAILVTDLGLAILVPVTLLAGWSVHRVRPGYLSSVAGRVRWRWLGRCMLTVLPLWLLYLGVGFLLDPPSTGRPEGWVLLLVLALVVTPFQAAGEEYLFRGWLVQNVAGWFGHPAVAWVVSTLVSSGLFALIHGSLDPWVFLDLAALGVVACYLNWRTGGLETGIALHVVNNVTVGIATTTIGGFAEAFIDPTTTGRPVDLLAAVAMYAVASVLLLRQGRRVGVQCRSAPAVAPPATDEVTRSLTGR